MSFKDIKGQPNAINILKKSIQRDRISQCFLFYGPPGVGKYLTALTFAKVLNCNKLKLEACNECLSCIKISNLNHPDVIIINSDSKKSTIKIDDIRRLQSNINLKCYESDRKICIIRDAERMTPEAENSSLKTLEDVPPQTIIILVSSNLQNMSSTVVSRCQLLKFRPLSYDIISQIVKRELNLSSDELDYVVALSEGSLEKVFNFSNQKLLSQRDNLIKILGGRKEELLFYTPEYNSRQDVINILDIMLSWYKDIFLIKNGLDKLVSNKDKIQMLNKNSQNIELDKLIVIIDSIMDTKRDVINNANIKLVIHNNMVRIYELEGGV